MTEQLLRKIIQQAIQDAFAEINKNVVPETMTPEQVAAKLGLEPSTLAVWRSTGRGPTFVKSGNRIMYLVPDINNYIEQNRMKP